MHTLANVYRSFCDKDGLTGWGSFFGKIASTRGAVGEFIVSDLVYFYQQQDLHVYPGNCLA